MYDENWYNEYLPYVYFHIIDESTIIERFHINLNVMTIQNIFLDHYNL